MRNLLNIYFSENSQSVCEELEEVTRANITDENGRVAQENGGTRLNNHTTGTNQMPEKKLQNNHINKEATDWSRGNEEKSNKPAFVMIS